MLLWKSIVSNPLLAKTSLVLFLNKTDILKDKLAAGIRFGHFIVSYGNRPNDYESTSTCASLPLPSRPPSALARPHGKMHADLLTALRFSSHICVTSTSTSAPLSGCLSAPVFDDARTRTQI